MAGNFRLNTCPCKPISLLLVVLVIVKQVFAACPSLCQCGYINDQKYVQCDNVNFTTLPSDIPTDTDLLFISSAKITSLTANYFSRLPNLNKIELANNHIENITEGVFNGLPKLQTLNLISNGIKRISSNAFTGLTSLTKLSLARNRLTTLPQNLIRDLTSLDILNVGNNHLRTIPDGLLNATSKLRILDLSKNQITHIPDDAFLVPGSSLRFIFLDNNKLSVFPNALYDLKAFYIMEIRLDNNSMTTVPMEAKSVLDRVYVTVVLSKNPYVCSSSLQWLQSWAKDSKVLFDKNQITCTTANGAKERLVDYDFNKTVLPSVVPTTTTSTTTTTTATTSTTKKTVLSTTHATPTTPTQQTSSSQPELKISTGFVSTYTEVIPTTSGEQTKTIDIVTDRVSSAGHIPAVTVFNGSASEMTALESVTLSLTPSSSSLSSSSSPPSSSSSVISQSTPTVLLASIHPSPSVASTNQPLHSINSTPTISTSTKPTKTQGEVNTSILNKNKHIILATCLSAVFIGLVVFIAMYCFRKKIVKRDKFTCSRYDRVRVV